MKRCVLVLILLTLTVSCGAARPAMTSPGQQDPLNTEFEDLRREQVQLLRHYEISLGKGESACKQLCSHHTRICELANRICAIADNHPEHPRALASCNQANSTCSDVTRRLPQECWCR